MESDKMLLIQEKLCDFFKAEEITFVEATQVMQSMILILKFAQFLLELKSD